MSFSTAVLLAGACGIFWFLFLRRRRTSFVSTDTIKIIPVGTGQRQYRCGHTGPKTFKINFWGDENDSDPEWYAQCPNCLVQTLKETTTQCSVCHRPIYAEQDAVEYQRGNARALRCTLRSCYNGETQHPEYWGTWDGKQFKHLLSK